MLARSLLLVCAALALYGDELETPRMVALDPDTRSINVDGVRLPIGVFEEFQRFSAPGVYLPRGRHMLGTNAGPLLAHQVSEHPATRYRALRDRLAKQPDKGRAELLSALTRGYGRPEDPVALHLLGNVHWRLGKKDAAVRWWRRAVLVNPAFPPSHLNLARRLLEQGEKGHATRELLLARAFNPGDGFGIAAVIDALAEKHGLQLTGSTTLHPRFYALSKPEELSDIDRRMARFSEGVGAHFTKLEDQAKLRSNLGLHFEGKRKPVLALRSYGEALAVLVRAGRSGEGYAIAEVIFKNMARTCRSLGWSGEAEDYEAMARQAGTRK